MNCSGLHCSGCGHGSRSWLGVVSVVVGAVAIAAKARAIEHGAAEVLRVLVVVAITALCVALAAGAVAAAVWYHRRSARAPVARKVLPVVIRELGPAEVPAIEVKRSVGQSAASRSEARR